MVTVLDLTTTVPAGDPELVDTASSKVIRSLLSNGAPDDGERKLSAVAVRFVVVAEAVDAGSVVDVVDTTGGGDGDGFGGGDGGRLAVVGGAAVVEGARCGVWS